MTGHAERTLLLPRALVLHYGGRSYVVPPDFQGLFAIGRGASCQIVLDTHFVSRLHGCIRVAGGGYRYRDSSRNGTIVIDGHDEVLVQESEVQLPPSGTLQIGNHLLTFSCQGD